MRPGAARQGAATAPRRAVALYRAPAVQQGQGAGGGGAQPGAGGDGGQRCVRRGVGGRGGAKGEALVRDHSVLDRRRAEKLANKLDSAVQAQGRPPLPVFVQARPTPASCAPLCTREPPAQHRARPPARPSGQHQRRGEQVWGGAWGGVRGARAPRARRLRAPAVCGADDDRHAGWVREAAAVVSWAPTHALAHPLTPRLLCPARPPRLHLAPREL